MSEWRKYRVGAIICNQYISQLDVKIRDAVLSNVGSMAIFRISQQDARFMEKEFEPVFERQDFINLPNYHAYIRIMIGGKPSKAFSAKILQHHQIQAQNTKY